MSQELEKVREAIAKECDKECPHSYAGAGYDSGPQLCEVNDKLCLLESGDNCSIWNNIKIDRIVAEMPILGINEWLDSHSIDRAYKTDMKSTYYQIREDLEAQCRLLAEQDWRKVNDKERMIKILSKLIELPPELLDHNRLGKDADFIIEKLLEGNNE